MIFTLLKGIMYVKLIAGDGFAVVKKHFPEMKFEND